MSDPIAPPAPFFAPFEVNNYVDALISTRLVTEAEANALTNDPASHLALAIALDQDGRLRKLIETAGPHIPAQADQGVPLASWLVRIYDMIPHFSQEALDSIGLRDLRSLLDALNGTADLVPQLP